MYTASETRNHADPLEADEKEIASALASRIQQGDTLAEQNFVERYSKGLLSFLRRKTNDYDLADDLHQDTLRIVLERLRDSGLENPSHLAGFVHATAKYLMIAHFRKQARRKTEPDCTVIENSCHHGITQCDAAMLDEQAKIVRELLDGLRSERDRNLLRRYYLCEQDKKTICIALGLSEKHFNRVIFRARERFRELLFKHENCDNLRILH